MSDFNGKSFEQIVAEAREAKEPVTLKDKLGSFLLAAVFIGLCVGMWMKPDLFSIDTSDLGNTRGVRKLNGLLNIIDFFWSRPLGVILGLLGVSGLLSSFKMKVGEIPGGEKK